MDLSAPTQDDNGILELHQSACEMTDKKFKDLTLKYQYIQTPLYHVPAMQKSCAAMQCLPNQQSLCYQIYNYIQNF